MRRSFLSESSLPPSWILPCSPLDGLKNLRAASLSPTRPLPVQISMKLLDSVGTVKGTVKRLKPGDSGNSHHHHQPGP